MDNLDIFIFTQGMPKIYPKQKEYKLVSIEDIAEPCELEKIRCDISADPLLKMEHSYSEGARIHYLWKHYPLKDYVGTAHYRRFFKYIPNIEEILDKYDAILPKFNLGWESILKNYKYCHNEEDLLKCIDILKEKFPEYADDADYVLSHDYFIPCNIFILKKEMFCSWCEFVFGILGEFDEQMGFKTDLDVYNHVVNNMDKYVDGKGGLPNSSTAYQSRVQAFLMERLSTIFFHKNAKNPYMADMVLTEVHNEFEKTYFKQYEEQDFGDNN